MPTGINWDKVLQNNELEEKEQLIWYFTSVIAFFAGFVTCAIFVAGKDK